MAFKHYLEEEDDKPYFTTNSLGYYYDKMEGFAEKVEQAAKVLNVTKEEVEKNITAYIEQNKNELDQRLARWDGKLETFDSSVETLLTEWVDDGTLTPLIDSTLIDQRLAPVTAQLKDKVSKAEFNAIGQLKIDGTYETLSALQTAKPTGATGLYLVTADGYTYRWDDTTWLKVAQFQSTGLNATEVYNVMGLPNPYSVINLTNILSNGNFAAAWSASNGAMTFSNNEGTLTATALGGYMSNNLNVIADRKYFVKALLSSNSAEVGIGITGTSTIYHSGSGNYEVVSGVVTTTTTSTTTLRIRDFRASGWSPVKVKWVIVIDLTSAFGAGFEPNNEVMKNVLTPIETAWFNGTTEVQNGSDTNNKLFANLNGEMQLVSLSELLKTDDLSIGLPLKGKEIVMFGDSVTEHGNYPHYAGVRSGATTYNVGFGGCRMAFNPDVDYDKFSMIKLADAIVSGNWSLQDTANANLISRLGDNNTEYLNRLKGLNFNAMNILTINYGRNDWAGNVPVGLVTDNTPATFCGAINYVVDKILTAFPHLMIAFITPTWSSWSNGEDADDLANTGGFFLKDYVDAMKETATHQKSPCLDLYRSSGINKYSKSIYLADHVHPKPKGYELLGNKIGAFLVSNY